MNRFDSRQRRHFLKGALSLSVGAALPAAFSSAAAQGARLPATPECKPGRATAEQTEGPFYTPRAPRKADFRNDAPGRPIVLEGLVLDTQCRPIPGAWLDFWHADANGEYDNSGFRLRGCQITDSEGRYRLLTILPAVYPGRTRHIHVKLSVKEGGRILTTQTYFPGEAGNQRDGLYRPELTAKRSGEVLRMDYLVPA